VQTQEHGEALAQFTMQYDYVTKVHQAVCAVSSNGTFSVRVSTVAESVAIKPRGTPAGAASTHSNTLSDIVITSVNCPAQTHASADGSRCLLSWCPPGEELTKSMESCMQCSRGRFSNDGKGHGLSCDACTLGKFCEELGCSDCTECQLGRISATERTKCSSCQHGLTPNTSLNGCVQCPNGKHGSFVTPGTCELCDIGKVSTVSVHSYDCIGTA
jgi:hypothetical protein